jgi:MOSC domain-containing protein YiiM
MDDGRCAECGFLDSRWDRRTVATTLHTFDPRWRWTIVGAEDKASILELVARSAAHVGVEADGATVSTTIAGMAEVLGAMGQTLEHSDDDDSAARRTVHEATHDLMAAGREVHALGLGAPAATGSVHGLFASGGGVPKQPILQAVVDFDGVAGDVQHDRRHHGRPFQALSLWSADVIDRLASEGHPIAPGRAGENVSVEGIEWPTLRPGTRLRVGDVLCEISSYATPCAKNAQWFIDGDFKRINHDFHPGFSRLYGSILRPGTIRPGDPVEVEPAG